MKTSVARYVRAPMMAAFPGLGLMLASKLGIGGFIGGAALGALFLALDDSLIPLLRETWYRRWLIQVAIVTVGLGGVCWLYPHYVALLMTLWCVHHLGMLMYNYDRVKALGENPPTPPADPPIIRPPG